MVFEFFTPGIAQVLKLAGCEYLIYDMEHAGFSIEQLKAQCSCCRGIGFAHGAGAARGVPLSGACPRCRGARRDGAHGYTVEQARAIAEATHTHPKAGAGGVWLCA